LAPGEEASNSQSGSKGPPVNQRGSQSEETLRAYLDPVRDEWNKPEEVIAALEIEPGDTVCDLGAGSGYFTFRLAEAVGPEGRVLAHDVDPSAVQMLLERVEAEWNAETMGPISVVQNPYDDPLLDEKSVDHLLMVDVHFLSEEELKPLDAATMKKLYIGIKPGGRVSLIEQLDDPQKPRKDGQKRGATLRNFSQNGFVLRDEYDFVRNHFFLRFERPAG
jgi:predicted methyltransferase